MTEVPPDFRKIPEGLHSTAIVQVTGFQEELCPLFIGADGAIYAKVYEDVTQLPTENTKCACD